MTYDELPVRQKAEIMRICFKNDITRPEDIRTAYNNYVEGRNIFDGLSESYQKASAFGRFLANGGHVSRGNLFLAGGPEENAIPAESTRVSFDPRTVTSPFTWEQLNQRVQNYVDSRRGVLNPTKPDSQKSSWELEQDRKRKQQFERDIEQAKIDRGWNKFVEGFAMPMLDIYTVGQPVGMVGKGLLKGALKLGTKAAKRIGVTGTTEMFPTGLTNNIPLIARGISEAESLPLTLVEKEGFEGINIPEGFSPVRVQTLRTKDGVRSVHLVRDNNTKKIKVLEDLDLTTSAPKTVDLKNYNGEKLTGRESGFDEWALRRRPENDHFPDLSHGLDNPSEISPIMRLEFESLPNGARVDLGETFSGDTSPLLLQFAYRHKNRIKPVLPQNPDAMVKTNSYGIRGAEMAERFNRQLERLLDVHGYSPNAVNPSIYNEADNTLSVPALSLIKLHKYGGTIK